MGLSKVIFLLLLFGYSVELLYVYDGDTIKVVDGVEKKIRLINIDAPESNQFFGDSSTIYLKAFLKGKEVDLEIVTTDQYGRELATVFADGEDVNYHLVRNGYAWAYQFCKDDKIRDAMRMAQNEHLGLWRYPNAVNPYYFRKEKN